MRFQGRFKLDRKPLSDSDGDSESTFRDSTLLRLDSSFCVSLRKFWRFQARDSGNRAIHDSRFCAAKISTIFFVMCFVLVWQISRNKSRYDCSPTLRSCDTPQLVPSNHQNITCYCWEQNCYFWRVGTTPTLKKQALRIWAEILACNQFWGVAPRIAPRRGFLPGQVVHAIPRVAPRMAFQLPEVFLGGLFGWSQVLRTESGKMFPGIAF